MINWEIPPIEKPNQFLTDMLYGAYETLVQFWKEKVRELADRYNYNGLEVVRIPSCPPFAVLRRHMVSARKPLHRLWWSWPETETKFVGDDIITWMTTTLTSIDGKKNFDAVVEAKVKENLIAKVVEAGKVMPAHLLPKEQHKTKDATIEQAFKGIKSVSVEQRRKEAKLMKKKEAQLAKQKEAEKKKAGAAASKKKRKEPPTDNDKGTRKVPFAPKKKAAEFVLPKEKEKQPAIEVGVEEDLLPIHGGDPVLQAMYEKVEQRCFDRGSTKWLQACRDGMTAATMAEIYVKHNCLNSKAASVMDLTAPQMHREGGNLVACHPPGRNFAAMATDALQVLEVFFTACNHRRVAPCRWNWEYVLFEQLGILDVEDSNLRHLAMLVCLVCSAAATDAGCIQSTKELHQNGYLDMEKLRFANQSTIAGHIQKSGINTKKAKYLIDMADNICKHHEGRCPDSLQGLTMTGIGRKTAVLQLNEAFGFFTGIGTDSHVARCTKALGWVIPEANGPQVKELHVEAALRTWVERCDYKTTNRLFGSFGQMFTQQFAVMKKSDGDDFNAMILAMDDYLHTPYQLELLWFMIKKVRLYYEVVPVD